MNMHTELTASVASAYLSNNPAQPEDLPAIIRGIHDALAALGQPAEVKVDAPPLVPAVSIKASIKPDYVTCLECGTKAKMLRRHLAVAHNLDPMAYRARWNLPADHTLVAPNYSEVRRGLAVDSGLGLKSSGRPPKVD